MSIVTSDILGWWDCQEGSGTTSTDFAPTPHTATHTSISWTSNGGPTNLPINIAYNGSTSKTVVSNDFNAASGSAAVWINPGSLTVGATDIIGNGDLGGQFDVFIENSTFKTRTRYGGSDRTIISSTTPSTGNNYFLVYNYTSGAMELFLNGSSVGTSSGTGSITDSGLNFTWGQRASGGSALTGNISQVLLFNRVLTSAEISFLYNSGAGITYAQAFPVAGSSRLALLGVG